ncbi:MAG: toprim domain-containing protein [Paracoccus sp. (in: a-proteobacteria)]|nr:toprim domain-containing protein [Paracoccus sp. (in: a-proteobacteria)]
MSDAHTLTLALRGKWYRRYGLACCPAHGDKRPSLSLADAPNGKLLLNCKAGCSFSDVLQALRDRGMIGGRPVPPDPAEIALREAQVKETEKKREGQALACWNAAQPIGGNIAETYLRGRGITCDLPASLRFLPDCWHASAKRAPAMIARVDGLPRFAVHRTYLRGDGSGKADLDPPKAMLGSTMGGAVRITEAQGPLVVCEGLETALSLSSGLLRGPAQIWAALSASGMAGLRLPERTHRLTIAPDGDAAGRNAAHKLAERATALGWAVSLLPAPEGRDWNDVLCMKKGDR